MKENFGELIKRLRVDNDLTLTQLGAAIGVDSGALSKIENNKKRLDEKCLPKLAKKFGLDLKELQDEFFSEQIAYEICKNECSEDIFDLIKQKVKAIKTKNTQQGTFNFSPIVTK